MSLDTQDLKQFIASTFEVDNSESIQSVASLFRYYPLKKGECVLLSGGRCDKMHFVKTGFLRVFNSKEGVEVTQWISTKGNFTADLSSFYFDVPSRWTIQAMVDSEIYAISRANYQKISTLVPNWSEIEKTFLVRCFTFMENRIHSHLSMSAQERYMYFYQENRELFNEVPIKFIASMLGMTPETMSRIRLNESKVKS
ncbi:MAG: CRP-like cAMP-binding protein [Cyclobacteriaceae bacterium]